MSDSKPAAPSAVAENWVHVASVFPGDCIPLNAFISVTYSNANLAGGAVGLECGGAPAPPDQPVAAGTAGPLTFRLAHRATGSGHTITAVLKNGGVRVTAEPVSPVSIGNPCAIIITGLEEVVDGFYTRDLHSPLTGTFDPSKGNEVLLMVEQPAADEYASAPLLVYADPAEVDADAGTWSHPAIRLARKGMVLRVVLTRDGEVTTTVRAMFV